VPVSITKYKIYKTMKNSKLIFRLMFVASIALLSGVYSCSKDDNSTDMVQTKNIVDVASADPNFSILVAALNKAGLASTLQGDGPFTVFAPTNAAFTSLLADLGISSLDELSAETLKPILLYHVLGGKVLSTDLTDGYVKTLSSGPDQTKISLEVDKQNVKLNGSSSIIIADIKASNGVIHVIDKVLLPPTVVGIALDNPAFSVLVAAVVKADLAGTLSGTGPFTVFAPTNAAFQELFTQLGVSGIADLTKEQLTPILLYHVVSGNILSTQLTTGNVNTLNGSLSVNAGSSVTLNGSSHVVVADVQGTNGVVHAIDKVLLHAAK
jgi:transforming growth factor-beta-induced protein